MQAYIATVYISENVARKLAAKHKLDHRDLVSSLSFHRDTYAVWSESRTHGRRLVVEGQLSNGAQFIAVLYPLDEVNGIWNLGTAWRVRKV